MSDKDRIGYRIVSTLIVPGAVIVGGLLIFATFNTSKYVYFAALSVALLIFLIFSAMFQEYTFYYRLWTWPVRKLLSLLKKSVV